MRNRIGGIHFVSPNEISCLGCRSTVQQGDVNVCQGFVMFYVRIAYEYEAESATQGQKLNVPGVFRAEAIISTDPA
jgi:hypothetical protein